MQDSETVEPSDDDAISEVLPLDSWRESPVSKLEPKPPDLLSSRLVPLAY